MFNCDITSELQVKKVSSELLDKKIYVDVLVNNADINPKKRHRSLRKLKILTQVEQLKTILLENYLENCPWV